jgi:hypothetical protein
MIAWEVERVIHFAPGDVCKDGFAHFGFHDREGRPYAVLHQKHFLGRIGKDGRLEWTAASHPIFPDVPNIRADLRYPMYVDSLPDDTLVVSNFGNARLYRLDPSAMQASLFVEGSAIGMKDAGNCVVDDEGCVWVNEVVGCRVWRFDPAGRPILTLGNGSPGFQSDPTEFGKVRFNWVYDIRRGPRGTIYVLDSKNYAVRVIDLADDQVRTLAGTGEGGYAGDGGPSRLATFGSDPSAHFDGPISLSLDEDGNVFIGDRFNHVVRMIDSGSGEITTIAGSPSTRGDERNRPGETDPLNLNLPKISSMDYHDGRLYVPTDLTDESGDLIILRKSR